MAISDTGEANDLGGSVILHRVHSCMGTSMFDFPPNGFKPPASSRSASAKLSLIFSPEF